MKQSILNLLTASEQKAVKQLKEELINKFDILDIRLYGSKARGTSSLESDIDIMIELDNQDSEIESAIDDIIYDINIKYDTLISAIFISRKMVIDGPMSESPIYKAIQREGISL